MYLELFHGRNSPDENPEDWGFHGPIIGPLEVAHVTYNCHLKIWHSNVELGDAFDVPIDGDMICYDGKWYGDWCFIAKCDPSQRNRVIPLSKSTLDKF